MLEMTLNDWHQLAEFIHAANGVHSTIRSAFKQGKAQVNIKDQSIECIAQMDIDPEFWLRVGAFIGSKLGTKEEG
jgi:hypothetical protein